MCRVNFILRILVTGFGILKSVGDREVGIAVEVSTLCVQSEMWPPCSLFANLIDLPTGCALGPTRRVSP
jgi:hypothetical protein